MCVCVCVCLPKTLHELDATQGSIFSGVHQIWIYCFPSSRPAAISMPFNLPIAGGRIVRIIRLRKVLVLCKMQTALSRIWTRVTVSISLDDFHYYSSHSIKHTYIYIYIYGVGPNVLDCDIAYIHTHTYIYMCVYVCVCGWLVGCLFYDVSSLFGSFNVKLSHFSLVWFGFMAYQPF